MNSRSWGYRHASPQLVLPHLISFHLGGTNFPALRVLIHSLTYSDTLNELGGSEHRNAILNAKDKNRYKIIDSKKRPSQGEGGKIPQLLRTAVGVELELQFREHRAGIWLAEWVKTASSRS